MRAIKPAQAHGGQRMLLDIPKLDAVNTSNKMKKQNVSVQKDPIYWNCVKQNRACDVVHTLAKSKGIIQLK
jgi:hypothetical protein